MVVRTVIKAEVHLESAAKYKANTRLRRAQHTADHKCLFLPGIYVRGGCASNEQACRDVHADTIARPAGAIATVSRSNVAAGVRKSASYANNGTVQSSENSFGSQAGSRRCAASQQPEETSFM